MSKYHWLLDPGHGGIDPKTRKYTTAPAKMHTFPDGLVIHEGHVVRAITLQLVQMLSRDKIRYTVIPDPVKDTQLLARITAANLLHGKTRDCIYLSIHSNAGGGQGLEVFTSPGKTKSDVIAEVFCNTLKKRLSQFKFRSCLSDGDLDKEEKFYVLVHTACPSVLLELLFFDNREEAEYLLNPFGQVQIAKALHESILLVEQLKLI
jgi:N-acetylmuramoyl-L-alanine amidase